MPFLERDAWLNRRLCCDDVPDDGPALPRDGVPYLPCPVELLLAIVEHVPMRPTDVFVDIGSGIGRAVAFVALASGVPCVGIEVQPQLVAHAQRLSVPNVRWVHGEAVEQHDVLAEGSVFFLYCPFSGPRLERLLEVLKAIAQQRTIWICAVDLPLPETPWLAPVPSPHAALALFRSNVSNG